MNDEEEGPINVLSLFQLPQIPDSVPDTRYYVIDHANQTQCLCVGRSKYFDTLYRISTYYWQYNKIYRTRLCERIFSASYSSATNSYLIVLLLLGDGIDPRRSYRSIFVSEINGSIAEYPVSNKTFHPQLISWKFPSESNLFMYISTEKEDSFARTYDLKFDEQISFKASLKKELEAIHWFGNGYHDQYGSPPIQPAHSFIIKSTKQNKYIFSDQNNTDNIQKPCDLPKEIKPGPSDQIRSFSYNPKHRRHLVLPQLSNIRCLVYAKEKEFYIIIPNSHVYFKQQIKSYYRANEYFPSDDGFPIYQEHVSRIPFVIYHNDLILYASTYKVFTCILIDQFDRIRAVFDVDIPDHQDIHMITSLNDNGYYLVSQKNGNILSCSINPMYFIHTNPKFVIPLLHNNISHICNSKLNLQQYITQETLRTYWNGEIYNELLLLYLRGDFLKITFQKVCSTFINSKRFQSELSRFTKYEGEKMQDPEEHHNFRDICNNDKISKTLFENVNECQDVRSFYKKLIEYLSNQYFDVMNLAENVQFFAYMQIQSIKLSFSPWSSPYTSKIIQQFEPTFFINISECIQDMWIAEEMLPISLTWPKAPEKRHIFNQLTGGESKSNLIQRVFWDIHKQDVLLDVELSDTSPINMMNYVEQLTIKTNNNNAANVCDVYQYLLGVEWFKPIYPI